MTPFKIKLPPSSKASEIIESVQNKGVFFKVEEVIIVGVVILFLTVLAIIMSVFAAKYCAIKRKRRKLESSSKSSK